MRDDFIAKLTSTLDSTLTELKLLVVVLPAFNEEECIEKAIKSLQSVTEDLESLGFELKVYVVNDGSTDNTATLAEAAGADRIVAHRVNQGLGAAVRSGLTAARADGAAIAIKFDADLQHDPRDIPDLIRPITDDEADLVYGNRFERISYEMPLMRRAGNVVFTKLMALLTGWPLKDSQPGVFAASRTYLQCFYLPGDYNYTQQVLLDAYHKGMRFAHVPVAFRERATGKSFVSLRYPFMVIPQVFMLLTTLKPLRTFVPIGLAFLFLSIGMFGWDLAQWLTGSTERPAQHVNAIIGFGLFGLQTVFFGLLGHLVIQQGRT